MKKIIASALCLLMVIGCFSFVSCNNAADVRNSVKVAMITDCGDITDRSFNQTSYEACKEFCEGKGLSFKYFKPAADSDDDRVAQIDAAIDEGYTVIVMPGNTFANAIKATVNNYPDVKFVALDVGESDLGSDWTVPSNLYCAVYREELCGYMAGYAAVKLGYKKLGFLGGKAVPAVARYGCGFIQGADAAAAELGLADVEIMYAYGNQFHGDEYITAHMDTWYSAGTEVVFACGGDIYSSAAEAAAKVNMKVIGVDVDQKDIIDGAYGEGITLTSAMKGLAVTVKTVLGNIVDGEFAGGKIDNLGIVSDVPAENYVQISETTQFAEGKFTQADYETLVKAMHAGTVTVSNDITKNADDFATVVKITYQGNIKN